MRTDLLLFILRNLLFSNYLNLLKYVTEGLQEIIFLTSLPLTARLFEKKETTLIGIIKVKLSGKTKEGITRFSTKPHKWNTCAVYECKPKER